MGRRLELLRFHSLRSGDSEGEKGIGDTWIDSMPPSSSHTSSSNGIPLFL